MSDRPSSAALIGHCIGLAMAAVIALALAAAVKWLWLYLVGSGVTC